VNVKHPLYRHMGGRSTVLSVIHEDAPQPIDGDVLRERLRAIWDDSMGAVTTHLDMLVSAGLVERTIVDQRDMYATVDWLDDMIADEGYMACAVSTVPRINAGSIECGRWVLMLGHELIAHASSLRALREGAPWPDGAVAWRVDAISREQLERDSAAGVRP
jgi:hypothetical protein